MREYCVLSIRHDGTTFRTYLEARTPELALRHVRMFGEAAKRHVAIPIPPR